MKKLLLLLILFFSYIDSFAAVPVVATTAALADVANSTTHVVLKPASTVDGDWMVMIAGCDGNSAMTEPAGWTEVFERADGVNSSYMGVYKKVASGEGASYTVTTGASEQCNILILRITGADATDCIDTWSLVDSEDTETKAGFAPVYSESNDSLIIAAYEIDGGVAQASAGYPSGYTGIYSAAGLAAGVGLGVARKDKATAGYEAKGFFTPSGAGENYLALTLVIRSTQTPQAYPAQPVIRSVQYSNAGSGVAMTFLDPNDIQANDLLMLHLAAETDVFAIPASFDQIQKTNTGGAIYHGAFAKVATGSEPSSYTTTTNSTNAKVGTFLHIVNGNTSTTMNQSSVATGTSTSPAASTITPSVNNCLILASMGADDDDIAFDTGFASGYTGIIADESMENADVSFINSYLNQTTAAATGAATMTIGASEEWVAVHIAVAPYSPPAAIPESTEIYFY